MVEAEWIKVIQDLEDSLSEDSQRRWRVLHEYVLSWYKRNAPHWTLPDRCAVYLTLLTALTRNTLFGKPLALDGLAKCAAGSGWWECLQKLEAVGRTGG